MTTTRTVLTIAALTLREAARRRVLFALAVLTLLLLGVSAWGSRAWRMSRAPARSPLARPG